MEINYLLSVIVVFLGLIIGIIIAKYTEEELKQGRKYFVLLQKLFLFIIFLLLLLFFKLNWIITLVLSLLFIIFLSCLKFSSKISEHAQKRFAFLTFIKLKKNIIMYNLLAIILFVSSFKEIYFIYTSTLIFLYGIPTGTLFYSKGNVKKFFLYYIWFLVIYFILYIIFNILIRQSYFF